MQILRNSWHFRLYCFTRRKIDVFAHREHRDPKKMFQADQIQTINLCPYMRTLLIYGPLLALAHLAVFSWLFWVYIYWPSQWFTVISWWEVLRQLGWIGLILLTAATALVIICYTIYLSYILYQRCMHKKEVEEAGFCYLVAVYYKSFHDRFCPQFDVGEAK